MFAARFYRFLHGEILQLFHNVDDGIILFITYDSMIYEVAFFEKNGLKIIQLTKRYCHMYQQTSFREGR